MGAGLFLAIALQCASPLASEDILALASADTPFAAQKGYAGQVLGRHPAVHAIAEEGIHGAPLPGGETLRLGKVRDPQDPTRMALAFQLAPEDPKTSGSRRAELAFAKNIEHGRVYWAALRLYVYDWGDIARDDKAIIGIQLHSGDNRRGLSPAFALNTAGARHLQVVARASDSPDPSQRTSRTWRFEERRIPFGRWTDFVFKFRLGTHGKGSLEAWMDGKKIAAHEGSLGFDTPGLNDYLKFGYYNWSRSFSSPRKVLVRSPVLVLDPTGSRYRPEDLRTFVETGCR